MNLFEKYINRGITANGNINFKIFCIIILNAIDGILTYIGVSSGYAVELNRIMIGVVSDFWKLVLVKILTPTVLLILIAYLMNKFSYKKMKLASAFINICFGAYIVVMFIHMVCLGMLFYSRIA
ncbi:MAG: DUF5658 family protein [Bacillota bacterium]|nr:DUF5658 family protein [Bacillota bacterium]